jgi:hypothetical protein
MAMVSGRGSLQGPADPGDECVGPILDASLGFSMEVVCDLDPQCVPLLGVDAPGVAGSQPLDLLDVVQPLDSNLQLLEVIVGHSVHFLSEVSSR